MLTTKMDDKSLKKVCLNLNNLSVSWQKMTSVDSLDYVYYENSESDDSVSFLDDFGTTLVIKENNTLAKTEFYNELNTLIRKSFDAPDTAIKSSPIKPEVALEQSNDQQLIERINLYNKYCGSNMLNISFERHTDGTLIANGLLKIQWKLSKPIRLENYVEVPVNFISHKDSSVLKMLNNEQNKSSKFISYDDQVIPKEITKNKNNISRANTISYRPKKFERKPILTKTAEENQLFMPANSSVSNIRIDSSTTCEQAIEILFEKYQISSSPDDYSLYKIQQNGDKKEFEPTELVLLNRIWMGPFNEDKIVIMEKGAVLQVDHQLQTFLSLPLNLLEELVDRLNREEENEITAVRKKYEKYRELLNYRLSLIGEYI